MTVFKYALLRGLKSPASLILNCVMPLLLIIRNPAMGFGIAGPEQNRAPFLVALMIIFGGFYIARSIQIDKMDGTIIRILAGPVTMRGYLVQNFLAAMIPMTLLSILIGVFGLVLHGWELYFAAGLAICYILLAATSIGLSFVWSCLFKDKEASSAVFAVLITAVATLSGLMIPFALLPNFLRYVGALFPAQWANRSLEALMDYGMGGQFWLGILAMALFTIAFMLYGGKRRLI